MPEGKLFAILRALHESDIQFIDGGSEEVGQVTPLTTMAASNAVGLSAVLQDALMVWGTLLSVITGQMVATGLDSPAQVLTPLTVVQSVTVTEPDVTALVVVPAIAVVTEDFRDA